MKRTKRAMAALAVAGVMAGGASRADLVGSFDDIQYWVGDGTTYRAALVIDWNDEKTPESIVWGFRWDGEATGRDMLQAVTTADPHFGDVELKDWGWGWSVEGLGYDLDGDGFGALDPDDHYQPGWDGSRYWAYFTYDGSASPWAPGEAWTYSEVGMTDRTLSNGSWDGWRYTADENGPVQGVAAVPEPAAVALAYIGACLAVWMVRRRQTAIATR